MKLSIVMPTLNAERYIAHALASIRSQDVEAELIVVDGGSHDATLPLVASSKLPHAQIIEAPGSSQSEAVTIGMAACTGDVVSWLNADDLVWPGALAVVEEFFRTHPDAQFLYGDAVGIDGRGRQYGCRRHVRGGGRAELLNDDIIVQPASFWRPSVWTDVGPLRDDMNFVFDYEFFLRVSAVHELNYLPVPLAAERMHGDRKTSKGGLVRIAEIAHLCELHPEMEPIPDGFVSQATTEYVLSAIRQIARGRLSQARALLRQAPSWRRKPGRTAARVALTLPAGESGFVRAHLVLTAAEHLLRREPLRPGCAKSYEPRM